eukprot:Cvel_7844.t2-p1 / transcript=Cvel_7844.t2 / gene=Cvel_7844 / organism=Chromera_velia_CCMP2878 / gene_product=Fibrillin-1, putative / transcript_product=Fibrillin-1, putative / location=Cvel_scaffold419:62498-69239(-) / protein_length=1814 / sequence_SO=supercontig / SO=protein_coding / is_pseudo=false
MASKFGSHSHAEFPRGNLEDQATEQIEDPERNILEDREFDLSEHSRPVPERGYVVARRAPEAVVVQCPSVGTCLESEEGTGSVCAEGMRGPVCSECAEGYFLSAASGVCQKCPSLTVSIIYLVISFLSFQALVLFYSFLNVPPVDGNEKTHIVAIRIMVNHQSLLSMIGVVESWRMVVPDQWTVLWNLIPRLPWWAQMVEVPCVAEPLLRSAGWEDQDNIFYFVSLLEVVKVVASALFLFILGPSLVFAANFRRLFVTSSGGQQQQRSHLSVFLRRGRRETNQKEWHKRTSVTDGNSFSGSEGSGWTEEEEERVVGGRKGTREGGGGVLSSEEIGVVEARHVDMISESEKRQLRIEGARSEGQRRILGTWRFLFPPSEDSLEEKGKRNSNYRKRGERESSFAWILRAFRVVCADTLTLWIVLYFLTFESVLETLVLLVRCDSLAQDLPPRVAAAPSVRCDSETYAQWMPIIAVCILAFGLVIPVALGLGIIVGARNLAPLENRVKRPEFRRRFGALILGFRPDFFWWEILTICRKLSMQAASAFYLGSDSRARLFQIFVIGVGAILLQLRFQPFSKQNRNVLNRLESEALGIWLLSILAFQIGTYASLEPQQNALILLLITIANFFFVVHAGLVVGLGWAVDFFFVLRDLYEGGEAEDLIDDWFLRQATVLSLPLLKRAFYGPFFSFFNPSLKRPTVALMTDANRGSRSGKTKIADLMSEWEKGVKDTSLTGAFEIGSEGVLDRQVRQLEMGEILEATGRLREIFDAAELWWLRMTSQALAAKRERATRLQFLRSFTSSNPMQIPDASTQVRTCVHFDEFLLRWAFVCCDRLESDEALRCSAEEANDFDELLRTAQRLLRPSVDAEDHPFARCIDGSLPTLSEEDEKTIKEQTEEQRKELEEADEDEEEEEEEEEEDVSPLVSAKKRRQDHTSREEQTPTRSHFPSPVSFSSPSSVERAVSQILPCKVINKEEEQRGGRLRVPNGPSGGFVNFRRAAFRISGREWVPLSRKPAVRKNIFKQISSSLGRTETDGLNSSVAAFNQITSKGTKKMETGKKGLSKSNRFLSRLRFRGRGLEEKSRNNLSGRALLFGMTTTSRADPQSLSERDRREEREREVKQVFGFTLPREVAVSGFPFDTFSLRKAGAAFFSDGEADEEEEEGDEATGGVEAGGVSSRIEGIRGFGGNTEKLGRRLSVDSVVSALWVFLKMHPAVAVWHYFAFLTAKKAREDRQSHGFWLPHVVSETSATNPEECQADAIYHVTEGMQGRRKFMLQPRMLVPSLAEANGGVSVSVGPSVLLNGKDGGKGFRGGGEDGQRFVRLKEKGENEGSLTKAKIRDFAFVCLPLLDAYGNYQQVKIVPHSGGETPFGISPQGLPVLHVWMRLAEGRELSEVRKRRTYFAKLKSQEQLAEDFHRLSSKITFGEAKRETEKERQPELWRLREASSSSDSSSRGEGSPLSPAADPFGDEYLNLTGSAPVPPLLHVESDGDASSGMGSQAGGGGEGEAGEEERDSDEEGEESDHDNFTPLLSSRALAKQNKFPGSQLKSQKPHDRSKRHSRSSNIASPSFFTSHSPLSLASAIAPLRQLFTPSSRNQARHTHDESHSVPPHLSRGSSGHVLSKSAVCNPPSSSSCYSSSSSLSSPLTHKQKDTLSTAFHFPPRLSPSTHPHDGQPPSSSSSKALNPAYTGVVEEKKKKKEKSEQEEEGEDESMPALLRGMHKGATPAASSDPPKLPPHLLSCSVTKSEPVVSEPDSRPDRTAETRQTPPAAMDLYLRSQMGMRTRSQALRSAAVTSLTSSRPDLARKETDGGEASS